MQTQRFIAMALFGLAAGTTGCATTGSARSEPASSTSPAMMTMAAPAPDPAVKTAQQKAMMEDCQAMKQQKQKLAEDVKAQAASLTENVARMNAASKEKKLEVMAEVVTQLVDQQIAMDARKGKMEEAMMKHMMKHMQLGKDSMAMCPMMKMSEDPAKAHAEQ